MTDTLRWIALLLAVYLGLDCGVIAALLWRGSRRPADPPPVDPPPAAPVNRDVLAPAAPLYGARRLETRPVPPVAGYTDAEQRTIDTIWRDEPTDPAPLRVHQVDWQAHIIERRN